MAVRTMTLTLDELDFDTIQKEIARYQAGSRRIDPTGPTILPDGESCLAGAILAEVCRDIAEYRALWTAEHD